MESQLAEYRAKRAKERDSENTVFRRFVNYWKRNPENVGFNKNQSKSNDSSSTARQGNTISRPFQCTTPQRQVSADYIIDQEETPISSDWKSYLPLSLKILLWILLWKYFISIGFGAVYFIVSGSYLMYRNTGTSPRPRNSLSAYSVFNPNHERLDGTFTAEQFEKELRHGPTSVQ